MRIFKLERFKIKILEVVNRRRSIYSSKVLILVPGVQMEGKTFLPHLFFLKALKRALKGWKVGLTHLLINVIAFLSYNIFKIQWNWQNTCTQWFLTCGWGWTSSEWCRRLNWTTARGWTVKKTQIIKIMGLTNLGDWLKAKVLKENFILVEDGQAAHLC